MPGTAPSPPHSLTVPPSYRVAHADVALAAPCACSLPTAISTGAEWAAGKAYPMSAFFSSSIFYTLVAMGVVLLPALFYGPYHWYVAVAAGVGPRCPPSSAHRTPSGGRPSRVTKHARSARSAGHRTA